MVYTVRFCHLDEESNLVKSEFIHNGDKIGRMGSSGQSSAAHLHIDLIQTIEDEVYHLSDISRNIKDLHDLMEQFHYFIDDELFGGVVPVITSSFGDPTYVINGRWKFHPAFDVVPENRHHTKSNFDIFWNRSVEGQCISKGFDPAYGNYVNIIYRVV